MSVRILFLDVDGVLTDGSMILDGTGETKVFDAHDGLGIQLARRAGIAVHIVTTGSAAAITQRARNLGIDGVHLSVGHKAEAVRRILVEAGLDASEAAFVGDDLVDLPAMRLVGTAIAVANARDEVASEAAYVTDAGGGDGAVREAIEWILRSEGTWDRVVAEYLSEIG